MIDKTLNLLEIAAKKRESLINCTNALRLVNGIGDGLDGLILEQYNKHFVAQIFDKKWLAQKDTLINFIKNQHAGEYFIVKDRTDSSSSKSSGFRKDIWIESKSSKTIAEENGLKFDIDLNDALNSGLFLDMRHNRKLVGELARGRKVLNAFAYTCSFGVYCRALQALSVINIDISSKILNRGKVNYKLNGITPSDNEFIRAGTIEYLKRAVKKDNYFDLIILDPPSFSVYEQKTFSVKKNLSEMACLAVKALNPGGVLFMATNFSGMSEENLETIAVSAAMNRAIKRIQHLNQDLDFPSSGLMPESYLAAVLIEFKS